MKQPLPGQYLVLGASGLMGSHALLALCNQTGVRVRAVGGRHLPKVSGDNIESETTDLTDPANCARLMEDIDYLLCFAGQLSTAPVLARDPLASVMTTLRVNSNALEAAWRAGVKGAVILSSTTGYPPSDMPLSEEAMFEGEPPSGWHALGWMTRYLETLCDSIATRIVRPMPIKVLRPSLIYGEFDHFDEDTAHFLPSLLRRVVNRENPIEVWGDGSQVRDVVHAADVVDAALKALALEIPYAVFNIVSGMSYSVRHILETLIRLDGFADADIVYRLDKPQTTSVRRFSGERAARELAFSPGVSLEEGLARTLRWYRTQMPSDKEQK